MGRPKKVETAASAEDAAKAVVKKPRGRNGAATASLQKNYNGTKGELGEIIAQSVEVWRNPKVKTDEECAERLNAYFTRCAEKQILPTVEEMALYLGTYRDQLWDWQNGRGCSAERCDMIKKAKQILATIDAKAAATGKIQPVVYIFRAKNFYGMRDQQDVVLAPAQPLGEEQAREVLEQKITGIVQEDDAPPMLEAPKD